MATLAAYVFIALTLLAVAFHIALAAGAPWGQLSWGGKFSGQLPPSMRGASVLSAILLLVLALAVGVRAGIAWPEWQPLSSKVVWGVVAYCGLAVIAHVFTPSYWERVVWLPVVLALFACSLLVARN